MSNRAEEVALEFVPANATKIMVDTAGGDRRVYSADEWREQIAAALGDLAEEARREELAACGRVLFGLADGFDALAGGRIGNEIIYGALTDKACFVRNLATTLGCVEEAPPCAP